MTDEELDKARAEEAHPRGPVAHTVKCIQPFFEMAWEGRKTFEVRKDDRDYQEGDALVQREFDGRFYGPRTTIHVIGYVLRDYPAVKKGYCVFSLLDPEPAFAEAIESGAIPEAGAQRSELSPSEMQRGA